LSAFNKTNAELTESRKLEKVIIQDATLYHGDCLEILPGLGEVDAVITDPPYPGQHVPQYGYKSDLLESLNIKKGMIFWTNKKDFPLEYTSVHIWDKKVGVQSQYERIFEINGGKSYKVFRHLLINCTVSASFAGDIFYDHPSQKPTKLMIDVVSLGSKLGETVCDPFMGSGTTGVACINLGRKFIGIEIERKYFDIACERIEAAYAQPRLFDDMEDACEQESFPIG